LCLMIHPATVSVVWRTIIVSHAVETTMT
jgi:hypothetical protein